MPRTRRAAVAASALAALAAAGLATSLTPAASAVPDVVRAAVPDRAPAAATPAARAKAKPLALEVLSGRADLVSGHSSLVAVRLPHNSKARHVRVTLNGRDVSRQFATRADGRYEGLVTGLHLGRNTLQATTKRGQGARLVLVDHPTGGPVFSGPQLTPWVCQTGAKDKQCNQAPTYSYQYMSSNPATTGFQAYDPANPPADVADTTTDNGVTVPFIVRTETGYMDRDQYSVSALYQPGKPWSAVAPQPQYDHKLLITHGASCGTDRTTGSAPGTTGDKAGDDALGKGYIVASTALDNSGHNCNLAVQAESLVMAKEHVIKTYGTLRYTIGTGCSGGSLAEQWIANAYPGVYQGILPTCSFPDAYSTATQFLDYHLLLGYFTDPSKWDVGSGVAWTPVQMNDVLGGTTDGLQNAEVSEQAQFHVAVPTDTCAGITDAQRYQPETNPGGVRCTIQDAAVNMFGPQPKSFWGPQEKKVGHGFVRLPIDNTGVQYGLSSLESGLITPAMFVDLNAKAGGADIDTQHTDARIDSAGAPSLARAYRTGLINEANHLDQVAIIDCRGTNPGLFHDTYRAFAVRARLDRETGTHANQVIWEGPVPLLADNDCLKNSFETMDAWLHTVEKDHSAKALPAKIIAAKPADVTDRCYNGTGQMLTADLCPDAVVPVEGTPRTVAGDAISTDTNKCTLKPLERTDYGSVTFTDAEWTALQKLYPSGVCDYTKRGVGQQDTVAWLTYQDAKGRVGYGGEPMGAVPHSTSFKVRAR